ncbi:MAG: hypothetical protein LLG01_00690 [Planctomycetaceae bacterium]|nr:hypothetical protein [Planctomycetaceae bacterium]
MGLAIMPAAKAKFSPADLAAMRETYARVIEYRKDPVGFGVNVLGIPPHHIWPKMRLIAESVRDNQKTAVPAGHSVSKTYGAGRLIVPWFKTCFQPSTVVTTAPSDNQVRNQLWRHIAASFASARVPLGGKLSQMMWDCKPSEEILASLPPEARECWALNFAMGFSTSPDSSTEYATKMQGWHNDWVLAILDEACGIMGQIWDTVVDALLVNQRCKVLAIGNPTDPEGKFADACRVKGKLNHLEQSSEPYTSDEGWRVIPVSVLDTPNYIEGREVIPGVAGRDYEEQICKKHPRGSNGWLIRIKAAFPSTKEGTYYGFEYAQAEREHRIGHYPYDPSFPVYRFADFGDVWTAAFDVQFIRGRIRVINDYWDNAGNANSHGGTTPVDGVGALGVAKSMQAMPYIWAKIHYAGPDLEGSNKKSFVASGTTTRDVLLGLGFHFAAAPAISFDEGIQAVRLLWPLLDIDERGSGTFLAAARGYGKLKNERMSTDEQPVYHNQPAPTWHRHMMDALRHLAVQCQAARPSDEPLMYATVQAGRQVRPAVLNRMGL